MKYNMRVWASGIAAALAFTACDKIDTHGSRELKTEKDKVSYGIGLDIGRSFTQQNVRPGDIDIEKLRQGILDVMNGAKPALTDSQLQETMKGFQTVMTARMDSVRKVRDDSALQVAKAFLEKNAKEPGVQVTPSGLQYKVLTEGKGPKPDTSSTVSVHYVGTLPDGTEFDSSIKRGQPVQFPVTNVIKGWTEALQMMPVGSKWMLFIPPDLGYGAHGMGRDIGPNAVLIFEVELLDIVKPEEPGKPGNAKGHAAH